jgi:predicted deacylase
MTVPVRIVHGAKDGRTVSMFGMVHGMATINSLYESLDPAELSGTVVGIPVTNPFAFVNGKRVSDFEYERLNLNRVFPGNAAGLNAERLARQLFDVVCRSDYHLDFHEGGRDFIARYVILGEAEIAPPEVTQKSHDLARWFGMGVPALAATNTAEQVRIGRAGASTTQASLAGKPSLGIELGGGGRLWDEYADIGVKGTTNLLKGLGMLTGELCTVDKKQHFARASMWPRPDRGGMWRQSVDLGDVVEADQVVGEGTDVFGDVVQELRSPYKAVILDIRPWAPIMPGEWTVHSWTARLTA